MSNTIKGALILKGEEEKVNDKLSKREFVIKTDGKYPKDVCFTLINDRADLIDPYQKNEVIEVSYDPASREYKGKWYTQLTAWKIEKQTYNSQDYTNDEQDDPF